MRFLALLACLPLACSAWSYSGGTYTTNGSLSDVQGACTDAATNNPTAIVAVPSGTYTWGTSNAQLTITSAISLVGNGGTVSSGSYVSLVGPTGTPTVISIPSTFTLQYGQGLLQISAAATVAGLKFVSTNSACGEPISFGSGSTGPDGFRVSNCAFDPTDGGMVAASAYQIEAEQMYGLIDHCSFVSAAGNSAQQIYCRGHTTAWGAASLPGAASIVSGIVQALYVENCLATGDAARLIEGDDYARFVVRFCTLAGGWNVDLHGVASDSVPTGRGGRMFEAYDNTWPDTSSSGSPQYNTYWNTRGGTQFIWGNSVALVYGDAWWGVWDEGTTDSQAFIPNNYQVGFTVAASLGVFTVTVPGGHGLTYPSHSATVPDVYLSCSSCNPALSGTYTVTVTSTTTLTVSGVAAVSGGTGGEMSYTRTPANYALQDQVGHGADVGGVPFSGAAGGDPGYQWNNLLNSASWARTLETQAADGQAIYYAETGTGSSSASFTDNNIDATDRDWFTDLTVSGSFNGTTGVGTGTYAAMQAITPSKTGVGFWVTNQATWNQGQANSGQFYSWSGSAWVLIYTPYQYPYVTSAPASPISAFSLYGSTQPF